MGYPRLRITRIKETQGWGPPARPPILVFLDLRNPRIRKPIRVIGYLKRIQQSAAPTTDIDSPQTSRPLNSLRTSLPGAAPAM